MEIIGTFLFFWAILVILFYGGVYIFGALFIFISAPFRFYHLANHTDDIPVKLFYYFGMILYILIWLMLIVAFILID